MSSDQVARVSDSQSSSIVQSLFALSDINDINIEVDVKEQARSTATNSPVYNLSYTNVEDIEHLVQQVHQDFCRPVSIEKDIYEHIYAEVIQYMESTDTTHHTGKLL
jgi:hypothetical protein